MNEPLVLSDEDSGTNASPVVFIAENGTHPKSKLSPELERQFDERVKQMEM
jgi:hypothetical protein